MLHWGWLGGTWAGGGGAGRTVLAGGPRVQSWASLGNGGTAGLGEGPGDFGLHWHPMWRPAAHTDQECLFHAPPKAKPLSLRARCAGHRGAGPQAGLQMQALQVPQEVLRVLQRWRAVQPRHLRLRGLPQHVSAASAGASRHTGWQCRCWQAAFFWPAGRAHQ